VKSISAELLFETENSLGEGPLWHPQERSLYWIDIETGQLFHSNSALSDFSMTRFKTKIGAFCFRKSGGFILATAQGFLSWDKDQPQPNPIWNPLPPRSAVRLNDGKVDPAGRFWAGSMDTEHVSGELYRLDPDGSQHIILNNIGISNGLDWSPDNKTMYYTDSYQYTIYSFDYDSGSGAITNQQPFIQLPKTSAEVVPDGLCVDAEGCIWSAQWNGWQVVRYTSSGEPILSVRVPAQRVTSCCFGGEENDLLFITTARMGLTETDLEKQPHAGDVFVIQTQTTGMETRLFG
jgi:sugar lactone lactonase YvrE